MYPSLPPQLKRSGLFCCWRYEQRKGKPTKVPYDPIRGLPAKSNDPSTFCDFETACCASAAYSGIGIGIFNGVSAIDLDNCVTDTGELTDTADEIVKLMHSYTECNAGQMDRLFRQSGLMRPKWDTSRVGSTYGAVTIQQAIQYCRDVYTPRPNAPPDVPPKFDTLPPPVAPPPIIPAPPEQKFQPFVPLQVEASQLPTFPLETLPQVIHDYIAALAIHTQTSVDMAAAIALGALAVCVQGKYVVEGKAGYTEPLNLYVVVIASPGERKSAVMQEVVGPIRRYEKQVNEQMAPTLRENQAKRKDLQRQITRLEKRLERTADPELELELKDCEYQLEDLPELKSVRYYADDCTPEALTSLLCANNGIFSVLSTEGGIFDILAGRYNRKPNLETWLKGHCGDEIRVDRRGREPEYIPRPTLSAVLTVQPSVLSEIMSNNTMEGRGLLARFLYCTPPSLIGRRSFLTPPVPQSTAASYELLIQHLMELPTGECPSVLILSSDAQRSFSDFFLEHEKYLKEGGRAISDWAAKYPGAVLRIAGLLHLAQGNSSLEISYQTLRSAITIGRYFLLHAEFAYTQIATDLGIQQALLVIAKLKELGKDTVRHYDLFRVCRGKFFHSASDIDPTLELLQEHGYLRLEEAPSNGRTGRKPGMQVVLNPVAFASKEEFTPF